MTVDERRRIGRLPSALLVLAASLISGTLCAADDGRRVEPQQVRLAARHHRQQLLITGRHPNGREVDQTHASRFRSANPEVATVSASGLIHALSSGQTTIHVRVAGQEMAVPVHVGTTATEPRVSFRNEVIPILTRLACNSGGCHGKSTGQNGFRLSLLGFEPEFDFAALVRESRGRRVSSSQPADSLLLAKATGRVPHGGGRRLDPDSDYYRVLLQWIQQGLRGPSDENRVVNRISIQPPQRVLQSNGQQQLLVTAHFSDGRTRDVTRSVVYQTNEPDIAQVDNNGLVTTGDRGGLFAVMVRFGDAMDVFRGTLPFQSTEDKSVAEPPAASQALIDRHLVRQWRHLGIDPSDPADDATFLRRAAIDVCGTLPTAEEVREFLADQRPDKRARLIDRLLERPEYARYFALKWSDILQNRGRGYSTSKQRAGTTLFAEWIRDAFLTNKPYDQFVAEILTASGGQDRNPPTIWYRSVRTPQDYVESIAQAFLGVRIQCAQCHHHPADRWSQADYYGLAAVFSRIGRKRGFADAEVPTNEIIYLKRQGQTLHPRTGQRMLPKALGGPTFELSPYDDPRRALARWMTAADNPFFSRTIANRMWGHFLGRGIVHPIDDARSSNPASNPELLDVLARDFAANGFDLKHLIRRITLSRAYQLSSTPTDHNEQDTQSYSRFYPRRLPAEVLLDGISQILEVETTFPGGPGTFPPGTRAIDLPDENVPITFLDVFGRPARTSACECERSDAPALAQALELVNSKEIQRKLSAKDGYVTRLATSQTKAATQVEDIFLRVFGRPPTTRENQTALRFIQDNTDRTEAYGSLLWALLATNEFLFNH